MNGSGNSGQPPRGRGPKLTSAEAQARLADALRDNLKRRKSQLRARDAGVAVPGSGLKDKDDSANDPEGGESR